MSLKAEGPSCPAVQLSSCPTVRGYEVNLAFLDLPLQRVTMTNAEATYDQLAHQVAALRKENCHLRRELEDNSNQLSKLETETFGMKVSLAAS